MSASETSSSSDSAVDTMFKKRLKTKSAQERAYTIYSQWKEKNGVTTSERSLLNYFFQFYREKYSPTTIGTHFAKLKRSVKKYECIDISRYFILYASVIKLEYQSKKSRVFTTEQLKKFLQEAPENRFLLHKVTYFMIF